MTLSALSASCELHPLTCCECGVMFAIPAQAFKARHRDHGWFYCPAGHPQHFVGESAEVKLRREVIQLKAKLEIADRQLVSARCRVSALKGHATRAAKREQAAQT